MKKVYSRPININDVDTSMKLVMYTLFLYKSSDSFTEVNDITFLDSWIISAQGHFTKENKLNPGKIINSLNGCPKKAVVEGGYLDFINSCFRYKYSNDNFGRFEEGLEYDLLKVIREKMNMAFVNVITAEYVEKERVSVNYLITTLVSKEIYIALGQLETNCLIDTFFYLHEYLFHQECPLVCTVFFQISKMEQPL